MSSEIFKPVPETEALPLTHTLNQGQLRPKHFPEAVVEIPAIWPV